MHVCARERILTRQIASLPYLLCRERDKVQREQVSDAARLPLGQLTGIRNKAIHMNLRDILGFLIKTCYRCITQYSLGHLICLLYVTQQEYKLSQNYRLQTSQSPDLNSTQMLWQDLKQAAHA